MALKPLEVVPQGALMQHKLLLVDVTVANYK